jgi:murein DD-endopeptidase MepM/ murein hydrolase activator NlpD
MAKKRQRRISILLIPDDNAEPYSFRLNWALARLLLIIGGAVLLHLIGGAIGYAKLYSTYRENVELERSNTRLLEDNKRVYRLAAQLEDMNRDQSKIMNLLGVESRNGHRNSVDLATAGEDEAAGNTPEQRATLRNPVPALQETGASPAVKGNFLRARKSEDAKVSPFWPSLLPVEGYLSREFERDPLGGQTSHEGIDIAAKHGALVLAAGEGTVVYAGWHQELGNVVILHHGNEIFSTYGHNERLLVRERERVKRGAAIALVGSSGRSSGPHLHFEVWQDGKAINPLQIVLALRGSASESRRANSSNDNTVLR